jgi:hypothetical protein
MQKFLTTISILLFIAFAGYGQGAIFNWAQNYTTPIDKIELDSLSNIYSIGGGSITKRTPSGTLLWTRTITNIQSLAVTPNGDIYITGGFTGTVNFNSWGAGYPMTSTGNTDIFVSKLNTNGDFVWVQRIGDVGADSATQISLDTLGHIYLTGKFTGSVDFNPGPSTDILSNGTDFILKLDTAGNYVWGRRLDLVGTSGIVISDVNASGKITCITYLYGTFDMNPGAGVNSVTTVAEYVLFQLDENGNFNWTFKIQGITPFTFSLNLLKVDLIGNIYISGRVRGEYNFGGWIPSTPYTSANQFVVKYNSNGSFVFGKQITSISGASGYIFPGGLDVDNSGNIYLSGVYQNNIYFDGVQYGSSGLGMDFSFYTCKILPNTQFEWIRIFGWNINPIYNSPSISCLAISSNGCLYNSGVTGTMNQLDMNFVNSTTPPFYIFPSTNGTYFLQQICQTTCPTFYNFDTDTVACYKVNNGNIIGTSGTYNIKYVSSLGCDSIVNTNLTLLNPAIDTITVSDCDSFVYNNQVFYQSGIYPFITNGPPPPMGCLSGTVLNLTIGSTSNTINTLVCDSITIAGVTYNSSGQYNQLINNPNGCDTNLTLNLTINHSQFDTTYATSCTNYTFNGVTYNTSGVFYQYYVAANLCDSIKVLYLDVLQPSSSTIIQTSDCFYTLNGQTYFNSGLHTQTFTNAVGCDSVVYLYLTINPLVVNVTQSGTILTVQNLNVGCQWVDCNNNFTPIPNETNPYFTPNVNGSYAVIINAAGCTDTSNCFVFNGVGFTEYIEDNTIQLYPNPTSNMVMLQSSISMQDATLRIYDMTGALLQEKVNLNGSKFQLNLTQYANGLYQIVLINQGVRYRSKVRKE